MDSLPHHLKGLVHAILGNFSIDQVVIELTEITKRLKTIEELKQNTGKLRRGKDGQNWGELKWIALIFWVNLKNVGPPFFKFTSVYVKMSFK